MKEIGALVKRHGKELGIPQNPPKNNADIMKIRTAAETLVLRSFFWFIMYVYLIDHLSFNVPRNVK